MVCLFPWRVYATLQNLLSSCYIQEGYGCKPTHFPESTFEHDETYFQVDVYKIALLNDRVQFGNKNPTVIKQM